MRESTITFRLDRGLLATEACRLLLPSRMSVAGRAGDADCSVSGNLGFPRTLLVRQHSTAFLRSKNIPKKKFGVNMKIAPSDEKRAPIFGLHKPPNSLRQKKIGALRRNNDAPLKPNFFLFRPKSRTFSLSLRRLCPLRPEASISGR